MLRGFTEILSLFTLNFQELCTYCTSVFLKYQKLLRDPSKIPEIYCSSFQIRVLHFRELYIGCSKISRSFENSRSSWHFISNSCSSLLFFQNCMTYATVLSQVYNSFKMYELYRSSSKFRKLYFWFINHFLNFIALVVKYLEVNLTTPLTKKNSKNLFALLSV